MENYSEELGMTSTVIVGNSSTYTFKDLMINPRGYKSKYNLEEQEIKNTIKGAINKMPVL